MRRIAYLKTLEVVMLRLDTPFSHQYVTTELNNRSQCVPLKSTRTKKSFWSIIVKHNIIPYDRGSLSITLWLSLFKLQADFEGSILENRKVNLADYGFSILRVI